MSATDGTSRLNLRDAVGRWPVSQAAVASIGIAIALAIFLLGRRASGAFQSPLPSLPLLVTAFAVAAWAIAASTLAAERLPRQIAALGPLCVLMSFAVAFSYPGARFVDWLIWISAIAVFTLARLSIDSQHSIAGWPRHPLEREAVPGAPGESGSAAIDADKGDHELLQRITRNRDVEGRDVIHGELIAEFAPGARQVTLYAAFCPPFEYLPNVEVDVADESDAVIKLTQVLHNGVQLEVRLPDAAEEPCQISIELYATQAESEDG